MIFKGLIYTHFKKHNFPRGYAEVDGVVVLTVEAHHSLSGRAEADDLLGESVGALCWSPQQSAEWKP